jgi:spore maturation protein CgeB
MTLSIVIPTLGRASLEDALASVVPQLHEGDEVIVVRDSHGDPQDTPQARARVVAFGPQVRYFEHDAGRHYHGGTAQANYGFTQARGDFVLAIGDDDAYTVGALAAIHAHLAPGRVLLSKVYIPFNGLCLPVTHEVKRNQINGCSCAAPREALQPFPLSGDPSADFDWMEAILAATGRDPVWLDQVTVIAFASRRNGRLANLGPTSCTRCTRSVLIEDTVDGLCCVCAAPPGVVASDYRAAHPRRIAFVWPAAEVSVSDVARGYRDALARAGHTILDYKLHNRFKYHEAALGTVAERWKHDAVLIAREASDGIAAFVVRHLPDLVVIVSGMTFHPDAVILLRRLQMPTVVIFTESPYNDEQQRNFAAQYPSMIVATNDAGSAASEGWLHLSPAFDPAVHRPLPSREEFACDVFFVGTGWDERQYAFERVDWTGIDVRLYGFWPGVVHGTPLFRHIRWTPYGSTVLTNALVAHAYASAKISLNMHRAPHQPIEMDHPVMNGGTSVNPRVMEILACGGFLLTDARPELVNLFAGIDIPVFDPGVPGDLEKQIRYWLRHEAHRREMADRMRHVVQEVMQGDTFDARVRTLDAIVDAAFTPAVA